MTATDYLLIVSGIGLAWLVLSAGLALLIGRAIGGGRR